MPSDRSGQASETQPERPGDDEATRVDASRQRPAGRTPGSAAPDEGKGEEEQADDGPTEERHTEDGDTVAGHADDRDTERRGDLATPASRTPHSADAGPSGSVTTLRGTLQVQDVDRTRGFLKTVAGVAALLLVPLPFVSGDALLKALFTAALAATAVSCLWLHWHLRDPANYHLAKLLGCGYVCLLGAFAGVAFFGPFSPAPVILPFGLYFFGLAHSFRGTLLVYAMCSLSYLAMALPIGFGWMGDRGLIAAPELTTLETAVVLGAVELVFLATYLSARASRRATEHALEQHDRAVRAIAGRDALLAEARMDLEEVLRARGLGRFTDEVVGRYRLGAIIGRGGMGEVYDAVHIDSEEPAAVKLLHPHVLAEPQSLERFLRECRVAASLEVDNVVRVLETSEPGAALPYIAMERLHGTDLADHLRAHGRMPVKELVRLLREVGRGLDAARAAGIVHRDLKPRNLFHAERPGARRGTWKILDFGVSKLAGEATMTRDQVVGTPSYMAPEQAAGGTVSHRTDLFALGVICYRALTGRPAFGGDSSHAILYQVVRQMPPRPSEIAHHLDPDLDHALAIALAKDPEDRFDSAAELADALDKAARGRLAATLRERARRVLDKHPWS